MKITTNIIETITKERKQYQKILLSMPLRAERLTVGSIASLSNLYSSSEVRTYTYTKVFDGFDRQGHLIEKSVPTGYYLHIDPLTSSYRSLIDFFSFSSNFQKRRFLLGKKGTGKTFNILLALNNTIQANRFSKVKVNPCYISFDTHKKTVYIKKPMTYATRNQWVFGGLEPPSNFVTFDDYIEHANLIVFDEIHYLLEHIIATKQDITPFITLLNNVLHKDCKVLLVSENILASYAEAINDKRFNDICLKFGLYPTVDLNQQYTNNENFDPLAFREIINFNKHHLAILNEIYGFNINPSILDLLVQSAITARGFFKLMKIVHWDLNFMSLCKLLSINKVDASAIEHVLLPIEEINYSDHDFRKLQSIITTFIQQWCAR